MNSFGKFLEMMMDELSVWRKDLITGTEFSKSKVAAHLAGEREPSMADRSNYAIAMGLSAPEFERRYQAFKNPRTTAADLENPHRLGLTIPASLYITLRRRFPRDSDLSDFCVKAIEERAKSPDPEMEDDIEFKQGKSGLIAFEVKRPKRRRRQRK